MVLVTISQNTQSDPLGLFPDGDPTRIGKNGPTVGLPKHLSDPKPAPLEEKSTNPRPSEAWAGMLGKWCTKMRLRSTVNSKTSKKCRVHHRGTQSRSGAA